MKLPLVCPIVHDESVFVDDVKSFLEKKQIPVSLLLVIGAILNCGEISLLEYTPSFIPRPPYKTTLAFNELVATVESRITILPPTKRSFAILAPPAIDIAPPEVTLVLFAVAEIPIPPSVTNEPLV